MINIRMGLSSNSVRIAGILIVVSLLFPLALADSFDTFSIYGEVIPSQGKESSYQGGFYIESITPIEGIESRGTFSATISYYFLGGPRPDRYVEGSGDIFGVFNVQEGKWMLQFSGDSFRGQLVGNPSEGFAGFIVSPGNGYLSQVFVFGVTI